MPKIQPFLWFDTQAEEAMNFYVAIFPNSKVLNVTRNGDTVFTTEFELDGQRITALNGGPYFKFTEAMSFFVDCADQAEVDCYWDALLAGGGQPSQCGWLKDRFGFSWQVIPRQLHQLMNTPDAAQSKRVHEAMMQMVKLDVAALEAAAAGQA